MLTATSVAKKEANKAVIVVPILAPIINGKDLISETLLVATKGMIRDVVIELDCTAAVKVPPHKKDL